MIPETVNVSALYSKLLEGKTKEGDPNSRNSWIAEKMKEWMTHPQSHPQKEVTSEN